MSPATANGPTEELPRNADELYALALRRLNYVDPALIDRVLAWKRAAAPALGLGEVLVQKNVLPPERHARVLEVVDTLRGQVGLPPLRSEEPDFTLARSDERPFDPLVGKTLGGYSVVERLGTGGYGTVYKARHEALAKDAVVKVLLPEMVGDATAVARFIREAQAGAKVDHPNIVRVYDAGTDPSGTHYIAMQLVDGGDMEDMLARRKRIDWREAAGIVVQVARGLAAAHATALLHRDVKPANILLSRDGTARLGDFGLVKDVTSDQVLTAQDKVVGTLCYFAPETGRKHGLDGRSDIYALGLVFYYAVTGVHPLIDAKAQEIFSTRAHKSIPPPESYVPDLPWPVSRVLGKMLEVDRTQRYADAKALAKDLEALIAGKPVAAGRSSLWAPPSGEPPGGERATAPVDAASLARAPGEAEGWPLWVYVAFALFAVALGVFAVLAVLLLRG